MSGDKVGAVATALDDPIGEALAKLDAERAVLLEKMQALRGEPAVVQVIDELMELDRRELLLLGVERSRLW